ncbi:MAG: hypothetical protein Q9219_000355 [cf. Caloplaca sp. 3 TL-2023]
MSLLSFVQRLFSLDTLDTRFTKVPADGSEQRPQIDPAKPITGVNKQNAAPKGLSTESKDRANTQPSRWATTEFFLYYLVIIVAIPLMFKSVYDVSIPSHPTYSKYEHLLSPGWILGRKVDNSDQQYSGFRDNIPYMALLLIFHPLLRHLYQSFYPAGKHDGFIAQKAPGPPQDLQADARLDRRVQFDAVFACFYLVALHGTSTLKVFSIICMNYALAKGLPKRYIPLATWVFNIGLLFANEIYKGYPYAEIARFFSSIGREVDQSWGSSLDSYGGLVPRWEILFNITVLRLVSFNLDYRWSLDRAGGSPLEKKQLDQSALSERDRIDVPAKAEDYSFRNYFAYVLYSPLYLAGPILTFNDYVSQLRYVPQSISRDRTILYGIRFLISLLTMEVMLHFLYAVAISKSQPAWEVYTPFQLSMLGYFNLHIIWLKLLLPWRFFRLWALLDGVDPPENMVRCMSDNYSTLAFWRGWHRSFNRWIVRYIYIPLGGSGGPSTHGNWGKARAIVNMLAVFTFVALWHDVQLKLLIWGWLVTLFVLPEVLASYAFPKRKWQSKPDAYRMICAIGAVGNILMMMAANLVGFAVGLDGLKDLVNGIVGSYSGLLFLVTACGALFVGAQIMFELREHELRHGTVLMPLKGHVYRLAATPRQNPVWIGDDILNHALHRWTKIYFWRRHGSAIPGPLEGRKRAMKRRITDLTPTVAEQYSHPGFLAGLKPAQANQQGWLWQAPLTPPSQDPANKDRRGGTHLGRHSEAADRSVNVALPFWWTTFDTAENDPLPTAEKLNTIETTDRDIEDSVMNRVAEAEPDQPSRPNSISEIMQSNSLDDWRKIMGEIGPDEHDLRRQCSAVAFNQLLKMGCDMDQILDFLGDAVLQQQGAKNFTVLVGHCVKASKIEEMQVLCKWVARQVHVGRSSDNALLVALQSLFNVRHQKRWRDVLEEFCRGVVEALRLSPVMHTEDLEPETWSNFVGVLFHDVYSEKMLDIGLDLIRSSSTDQLERFAGEIWPVIEHWTQSWHPAKSTKMSPKTLTSKVTTLLQLLPQSKIVYAISTVSWHLLDQLPAQGGYRTRQQRHSIWWSAVHSLDTFPQISKRSSWYEVAQALRRRQAEDAVSKATMEINYRLKRGNIRAAYQALLRYPQMSVDHFPDIVKALILESESHAKIALEMLQKLQPPKSSGAERRTLKKHRQQRRRDFLETMALAYSKMSHTRPSFAFRCVYECWSLYKRDKLGPITPGIARALLESGVIRPLQTGRRLVSESRLEWMVLQVAEAEGKEVMRRAAATALKWRDDVVLQMQDRQNSRREELVGQQASKHGLILYDPDRWETLKSTASTSTRAAAFGSRDVLEESSFEAGTNDEHFTVESGWNDMGDSGQPFPFSSKRRRVAYLTPQKRYLNFRNSRARMTSNSR